MFKVLMLLISFSYINSGDYREAKKIYDSLDNSPSLFSDYIGLHLSVYSNDKEKVRMYAERILDSFEEVPVRYERLSRIMLEDIEHWNDKGLEKIKRDMKEVKTDLKSGYADKVVQIKQEEIVKGLDDLIKDKEEDAGGKDKNKKKTIVPGSGVANRPQDDSTIAHDLGKGEVSPEKFQKEIAKVFALPEKERAKAIMGIVSKYPVRYQAVIEEYFKSLSK